MNYISQKGKQIPFQGIATTVITASTSDNATQYLTPVTDRQTLHK